MVILCNSGVNRAMPVPPAGLHGGAMREHGTTA
jgi:hypothetical protein